MKLRYFDSAPEHCGLWPQISLQFVKIPATYSSPQDRKARIAAFFADKLPHYRGAEPLLLIYHINERKLNGEVYALTQEQLTGWAAADRIYAILVTGGEPHVAQAWQKHAALPTTHVHVYPFFE